MKIKGFDKNLQCRGGFQFEIGKEYKIDNGDKPLELRSGTVFHYCDSLRGVHQYYSCNNESNRFCEIEVLGEEVTDGELYGSNHIRIVREICGAELDILRGRIGGNAGLFNSGDHNSGNYNSGNCNSGNYNSGNYNSGYCNSGYHNSGNYNSGNYNSGNCNSGNYNSGYCNSGYHNSGNYNSGDHNSGNYNSGNCNSGNFNICNYSSGFFCTEEPKAVIFDIQTDMTVSEFRWSKWYKAITSSAFRLTQWVDYSDEEKKADIAKAATGGYLKTYTYQEACANWWKDMTAKNRKIIKTIPGFTAEKFKFIYQIS